jgi:hypothetical protein
MATEPSAGGDKSKKYTILPRKSINSLHNKPKNKRFIYDEDYLHTVERKQMKFQIIAIILNFITAIIVFVDVNMQYNKEEQEFDFSHGEYLKICISVLSIFSGYCIYQYNRTTLDLMLHDANIRIIEGITLTLLSMF